MHVLADIQVAIAGKYGMTETTKFFITAVAALVGSGLGTTIIGALFKRRFDAQLETRKALL